MVRGLERTQESLSTFTLDGFVAGTWGFKRESGRATLTITPLAPLSKAAVTALSDEGAGLVAFLADDATDREIRFAPPECDRTKPNPDAASRVR